MALYGKNSVLERLKSNPASIKKIFLQDNFDVTEIESLIKANKIPAERASARELARIRHAKDLQGVVARIERFEYSSFDELLNRPQDSLLTLIFLDKINDPQNLGVIIRTAACFGGFAVIIPKFRACEVNETVLHVASGGENYVPVSMVSNLSNTIIKAKACGYWVMGTLLSDDAEDISKITLPFPLALVLGSEGEGISYGVQKRLDVKARIPMRGAKLSFNVSMACAVFCHEITKQRGMSG
ncbi:MAG: 23S rRNA (guanosine(2251)-2'-O)-methyltransferase RlmB [Candidatus Omnitrophica bacterium]|nr:23S rRNA (guanosine(2251)-2'-O)-methyltransferase RlmB [Candidatus Omnitrophota bacterium]